MWGDAETESCRVCGVLFLSVAWEGWGFLIPLPSLQDASPPGFLLLGSWPGSHTPHSLLISADLKPSSTSPLLWPRAISFLSCEIQLGSSASFYRATPNAHPSGQGVSAPKPTSRPSAQPPVTSPTQAVLGQCTWLCSPQDLELLLEGREAEVLS